MKVRQIDIYYETSFPIIWTFDWVMSTFIKMPLIDYKHQFSSNVYRILLLFLISVESILASSDFSFIKAPSLESRLVKSLSFEEEYKLFEDELDQGIANAGVGEGKSRQKRYVFLNTEANVEVGFLIVIPVTVILPAMTNLFNNWRRKRSIENFNFNPYNVTSEPNSYLQSRVNLVTSYFDLINIPETSCQLRAICEFSADPSRFFPVADIILSQLKEDSSSSSSLFGLYTKSMQEGGTFGTQKCGVTYGKVCKYSVEKLLDMSALKFWNKVQSRLRLKFEDDFDNPNFSLA